MNDEFFKMGSALRLCLVILFGLLLIGLGVGYWKSKHPNGVVRNWDYSVVQVANKRGEHLFDLHKGESRYLEYGTYKLTIPDANASYTLWKNNRGCCDIHSSNGVPVIQTDGNCGLGGY